MLADGQRWNHNVHYHRVILDAIPSDARRALDVGCGEGVFSRRLRERALEVTAIDVDPTSVALARHQDPSGEIAYVLDDFLTWACEPASFDVVVSVAALHHMDARAALQRMRRLLRPGGVLAVVGLARRSYPADLPRDIAAAVVHRAYRCTRRQWESPAPTVWPPSHTYAEIQALAESTLGAVTFRRHLLWRYSLIWTKPAEQAVEHAAARR